MSINEQPEPNIQQEQPQPNTPTLEQATETTPVKDQITEEIKQTQQAEMSYIVATAQADDKRTKYLAKQSKYLIAFDNGDKPLIINEYTRRPLSSKKNKEIDDFRSNWNHPNFKQGKKVTIRGVEFEAGTDVLYHAFKLVAKYCLGFHDDEQFDNAIWEDDEELIKQGVYGLRSIVVGCLLRAVHGIAYFPQT